MGFIQPIVTLLLLATTTATANAASSATSTSSRPKLREYDHIDAHIDNIRAKENGVNHLQEPLSESPVILENQFSSIVDYVNTDESATWEASIDGNQRWAGKPLSWIKRQMGAWLTGGPRLPLLLHNTMDGQTLPKSFDARDQWKECPTIAEIRDQSECGSCWAFGAIESASDRVCIDTKGEKKSHLSADDVLACCGMNCGDGCNGGWPAGAFNYLAETGSVTGGNYKDYTWCLSYPFPNCDHHTTGQYPACQGYSETPACISKCDSDSNYNVTFEKDKHIFASAYSISSDEEQIMKEIFENGPVETAFSVYADFLLYKKGVYKHTTGEELGGHAVRMLGWGVDTNENTGKEVKYWLLANSWNTDWGDNGFFKIIRGSDHCGIESSIVAGSFKSQQ